MDFSIASQSFQKQPPKEKLQDNDGPKPKKSFEEIANEKKDVEIATPCILNPHTSIAASDVNITSVCIETVASEIVDTIAMQKENGIERTTMICSENSTLSGLEVMIDHYDTAPDSFSIHFVGPPEIAEQIDHHLPKLKQSLERAMPNTRFLLPKAKLPPVTATTCAKQLLD